MTEEFIDCIRCETEISGVEIADKWKNDNGEKIALCWTCVGALEEKKQKLKSVGKF